MASLDRSTLPLVACALLCCAAPLGAQEPRAEPPPPLRSRGDGAGGQPGDEPRGQPEVGRDAPRDEPPRPDEEAFRLRFGVLAALTWLRELEVGGVRFDRHLDDPRLADSHSQVYAAWIDLGRWVTLRGRFQRVTFREDVDPGHPDFVYDGVRFPSSDAAQVSIDASVVDLDLVVHVLGSDDGLVSFDLAPGARYAAWRTSVRWISTLVGGGRFAQRVEGVLPTAAAGLSLRPVRALELFARGRAGWIAVGGRDLLSLEVEVGIHLRWRLFERLAPGAVLGYRFERLSLEREPRPAPQYEIANEGLLHGPFAGLALEF